MLLIAMRNVSENSYSVEEKYEQWFTVIKTRINHTNLYTTSGEVFILSVLKKNYCYVLFIFCYWTWFRQNRSKISGVLYNVRYLENVSVPFRAMDISKAIGDLKNKNNNKLQ